MNKEILRLKHMDDFLKESLFLGNHNHTEYSNLRLPDCINISETIVDTANKLNHKGVCITDHECISSHIRLIQYVKNQKKKGKLPSDFKLGLGNEIYLVDSLEKVKDNYVSGETKFYHFVLVAKDLIGHKQLREISSSAWVNLFKTGKMERTPTTKKVLEQIINKNKGHLIASTACLGSEFAQLVLQLLNQPEDKQLEIKYKIHDFITWCLQLFGKDDFYIELQPSRMAEQIAYNKMALTIARAYGLKYIFTTDTHYLRPQNKKIHQAYLNSKEGDREVEDFYSSTYMMKTSEIYEYVKDYICQDDFKIGILNTLDIYDSIQEYDLFKNVEIPQRQLPQFELQHLFKDWYSSCEYLNKFAHSEYAQDRFFLYMIEKGFLEKKQELNKENIERINIEMEELWGISEILNQRMSSYYNLTELIIELMWSEEYGNSLVGIARGSVTGFYTAYLIGITQMNPIKWNLPHWRHISKFRPELPDVDIDSESSKRQGIFKALKKYFGGENVLNIATFKTEGSKSSILTACRGLDIDNDIAQAIGGLIPFERGKHWSLSDCLYGNEEKDRKPIKEFINEIEKYEGLKETALGLEGLICGRSIHASGVYIFNNGYLEQNAMMKAPNGVPITCWSMNDSDYAGSLKFDALTIEALDKMRVCLNLLLEDKKIEWQGSLRATYDKYLHPNVIDHDNLEMWHMVGEGTIPDLFQFSTDIGIQTAKKVKPTNLIELAHSNSLMRLMGDGTEQPTDKYIRFKKDITLWYDEMRDYNLTEEEIKVLEKHLLHLYGVGATQEDIMRMSMDSKIGNFDIVLANKLRKSIAKKKEDLLKEVKDLFFIEGKKVGTSDNLLNYVWEKQIMLQAGYSFSSNHTFPYSEICVQELNLAFYYNKLYWNTAVLTVNSGAVDEEESIDNEDIETGADDEENTEKKKTRNAQYGKIAKAIGEMVQQGVSIALPHINKAKMQFAVDEENNRIIFGLKGITNVGDEVIKSISEHRPFNSAMDFHNRLVTVGLAGKTALISLIKAGAFDEIEQRPRETILKEYIQLVSEPKKTLGTKNMNALLEYNMIPQEFNLETRFFKFRKYITNKSFFYAKDEATKSKKWFKLNEISGPFFTEHFIGDLQENKDYKYIETGEIVFLDKNFDKVYESKIKKLKDWLKTPVALEAFNYKLFIDLWNKYCNGSISKWEMDSISFYYGDHELLNIQTEPYNIENFVELSPEPIKVGETKRGKRVYEQYQLCRIAGTVLDKNKNKHTVDLLTTSGVVTLKYYAGAYNFYDKQISCKNPQTNKKQVLEKSWFSRGNKLMITGFRRGDMFVPKTYSNSIYKKTTQIIDSINQDKTLRLRSERVDLVA